MRKALSLLITVMLLCTCVAFAEATEQTESVEQTLRDGKYVIGKDIPAGTYKITCIETEGEKMGEIYGSLGDAMDAMDEGEGIGSLFDAFGGMMSEFGTMSVEILGDYGDVLQYFDMEKDDSINITLEENTALQIDGGRCTIVLIEEAEG